MEASHTRDEVIKLPCRHGVMHFCPADEPIGSSLQHYGEWAEAEVQLFA
jgi:hypothetical protein